MAHELAQEEIKKACCQVVINIASYLIVQRVQDLIRGRTKLTLLLKSKDLSSPDVRYGKHFRFCSVRHEKTLRHLYTQTEEA